MSTLTVGLTGGIASGKSLVAGFFEALGVPVLDADLVARAVVAPGQPALARIAETFGAQYLQADGQLDRRALRERVFPDPEARRKLEGITHPAIRAGLLEWRERQSAPYCILSVAILLEAGMRPLVDRVLVIDVAPQIQVDRLLHRDGITPALAHAMLAAQAGREARREAADDLLENAGTPEQTRRAVERLHAFYLGLAAAGTPRAPGICLPN